MIAIVGAGISGLTLAHEFAMRGIEHVVLESTRRVGGVIRSEVVDGHLLEFGPQRTRLAGSVATLVAEAGLMDDVIRAPADLPLLVYRAGRLREVPMSFAALRKTDLLSTRAKLRILAEPFTGGENPDESVAQYFIRKLGYETYANLVGPLYGGLYASDPADMMVGMSLTNALKDMGVERSIMARAFKRRGGDAMPPACSFEDGMQALPDALYRRHSQGIEFGRTVRELRYAPRQGFRLEVDDDALHADRVVLTGSARSSAELLRHIAPVSSELIRTLHYNPLGIVHMHTTDVVQPALGYQVGFDETMFTRGVTFNHSLFHRTGVYTAYLGGAKHPEVAGWDDDAIAETALAEFEVVTGASARAVCVSRAAMPAWDRSWAALGALPLLRGVYLCANWQSRPGLPGRIARARTVVRAIANSYR